MSYVSREIHTIFNAVAPLLWLFVVVV